MKTFMAQLDEELAAINREVSESALGSAAAGLEDFFGSFISAGRTPPRIDIVSTSTGRALEITLEEPLQYLYTGTGIHGPEHSEFIVASPNNVLSWVQDGERRFASYVYNPGLEAKFTDENIKDAAMDAILSEEYDD